MEELFKSIKAYLYDRTVSPLIGAYVTAWSVWNYKVFLVLLDGDAKLQFKLEFLEKYFGPTIHIVGNTLYISGWFYHGLFWPILMTMFYLYGYPIIAKPVYESSLQNQIDLREAKQKKEKLRLLTAAESGKIQKEIEQLRARTEKEVMEYRSRISSLTETITALEADQNREQAKRVTGPEQVNISSLDELSDKVRSSIETLPDGEFQLTNLFKNSDWNSLPTTVRSEYGKLFRKMVERGDFADVAITRKGAGNQLIYRKGAVGNSTALSKFEEFLVNKIRREYFPDFADLNESIKKLLSKIASYCVENHISENMLELVLELVHGGKDILDKDVERIFEGRLSTIEIDVLLRKLRQTNLISSGSLSRLSLSSEGKEMAVDSGLTLLDKMLSQ